MRPVAIRRQKGLGLGLEALLGPSAGDASSTRPDAAPTSLPMDRLQPGRYQPRTRIDDASLAELAASVRSQGVMQPVLVRPLAQDIGRYEIIAGERRFRAATMAGLDRVPVVVHDVDDRAAAAMALIENIQREDLNPLDEARGLQRLVDEFGLTHEAAAQAVGRSRSAASNLLRLLQLAEPVQKLLRDGALEMGHARALLPLAGARQVTAAHEVVARKLSVREAERLVAREVKRDATPRGAARKTAGARATSEVTRIEQRLADVLAAPVSIRVKGDPASRSARGEIAIGFASLDEMNGLLARLGLEGQ